MSDDIVRSVRPLGFPWITEDPFLFCVYHDDKYPAGDAKMAPPRASLAGRNMGQDFEGKDGWRMYHGEEVPGFPPHPHRGFETVTIARRGYIDHSDSLGATARFGSGDVQWLTAGGGIVHSEMFPLVEEQAPNPLELFQIWLNLPAEDKMRPAHFSMLWNEGVPRVVYTDEAGKKTQVQVIAGALEGKTPPPPPPHSWASRPDTDVAIWSLQLEAGAVCTLPPATAAARRNVYFFAGPSLKVGERSFDSHAAIGVRSDAALRLEAGDAPCEVLILQGRPIAEPVVQHGPFVMNKREEIMQTMAEYQRTRFGGWPFSSEEPVHPRDAGRFAKHADGRVERPESK